MLIAGGLAAGGTAARRLPAGWPPPGDWLDTGWLTAVVLFLMAFSLDSAKLVAALRRPGAVLWACGVNAVLVPLVAWPLSLTQGTVDFRYGLMIAAAGPCTMAAAGVWTRRAGGNDAVALLVTLLTNGLCFAVAPLWLAAATGRGVELGVGAMTGRLLLTAVLPMGLGQLARRPAAANAFAVRFKGWVSNAALCLVLGIVFTGAARAGATLAGSAAPPSAAAVAWVWACCLLVHAVGLAAAWWGAGRLGFAEADRRACAFAGSQKTLPVGLLIATGPAMFGDPDLLAPGVGVPLAVFPMLMYHAGQLVADTVVAGWMRRREE